jgi:hypothetical protein
MVIIVTVNLACFKIDIKKSVEIAMHLLFCFFYFILARKVHAE